MPLFSRRKHDPDYDRNYVPNYDRTYGPTHDRTYDRDHDRNYGLTHDRAHDQTYGRGHDSSLNPTQDRTYDRAHDPAHDRTYDSTHDRTRDQTYDRAQDRSLNTTHDRAHDQTLGRGPDRSLNPTHDQTYDRAHDRPLDRTYDRTNNRGYDRGYDRDYDRDYDRTRGSRGFFGRNKATNGYSDHHYHDERKTQRKMKRNRTLFDIESGRFNKRPSFGQWLKFTWLDILTMAAMGAVGLGVYEAHPAPSRSFPITFSDGQIVYPQFAYPLRTEIIPIWEAALLGSLVPIAVILLMQIRIRSFWDVNNAIIGLLYSLISAAVFQVFVKWLIGGLRPHFLAVCDPNPALISQGGGGFQNIMFQRNICRGNMDDIDDSLESMPSGHTTAAFAGFVYLYLYLNAKLKVFSNYHPAMWKLIVLYAPILGACLIGGALTIDEYHNWYDVFAGAVIGTVMAFSAYRMLYASVWDFRFNHIPLTRHTPFSYGAGEAGAGGFETAVFTRQAGWGDFEAYGGAPFDAAYGLRSKLQGFNNAVHQRGDLERNAGIHHSRSKEYGSGTHLGGDHTGPDDYRTGRHIGDKHSHPDDYRTGGLGGGNRSHSEVNRTGGLGTGNRSHPEVNRTGRHVGDDHSRADDFRTGGQVAGDRSHPDEFRAGRQTGGDPLHPDDYRTGRQTGTDRSQADDFGTGRAVGDRRSDQTLGNDHVGVQPGLDNAGTREAAGVNDGAPRSSRDDLRYSQHSRSIERKPVQN